MQGRSKAKKHTVFKAKERTTCALPSLSLFSNDNDKEEGYTQGELDTINNLVLKRRMNRKVYSRTLIDTYTPLTKLEKVKVIADMDESSTNRFKKYSDIFDQIKQQISDINTSLCESFVENREACPKSSMRKTMNLKKKVEFIEEKEEEDFLSPKYVVKTTPPFALDGYYDQDTFSENIKSISLRESPINNSSILLVQSKMKGLKPLNYGYSNENLLFLQAKEEYKRSIHNSTFRASNSLFNSKRSYSDSISFEDKAERYGANKTQYCNCLIQ